DSNILLSDSNSIAGCHGGEDVPTGSHGLWPWRFVVAIPTAETGNDPGEPWQRAGLMRIFLALGAAFEGWADGLCGGDELCIGNIGCGPRTAVSSIDELDGPHRSRERNS